MTHTPRLTTLSFVFAILLLPAFAAGRNHDGAQQRGLDGSKLPPAQPEARPAGGQKVFRGSVADRPARMTLRRSPSGAVNGSYSYDGRAGELTLKGSVDAKGNLTLEEFDGARKTGVFKGTWDEKDYEPEASLYGDWKKPVGGDTQYFYFAEQPQPAGGHAVETKQINEVNKKRGYRINVDYPQIEGAAKFNQLAAAFATKEADDFRAAAGRQPGETDSMPEAADDSLDVRYFLRSATPEIISVEFQMDYYEHGAAHGSHAFHVINYDARAGRELKLSELFRPGSDYLKRVSEVAIRQVRRWNKDSAESPNGGGEPYLNDEGIESGASPDAENYQNWTITPRGLAVTFDYYQLGPYAAGAQKVVLPYADLKEVVKTNGPLAPFLK